jgi:hypothetical protein
MIFYRNNLSTPTDIPFYIETTYQQKASDIMRNYENLAAMKYNFV